MPSISEKVAKLERRVAERERKIEIIFPSWLTEFMTSPNDALAAPPPNATSPAPEQQCDDCGYVIPRRARFCAGCGVAVAEPSR
ncbi:MAG: hypothetical protein FJ253_08415 [Phycisphaerae bacterium]|nr:hypothetical protein [Phycisphaerae bacterium]